MMKSVLVILATLFFAFSAGQSFASEDAELKIVDDQGFTRATSEVSDGVGNVEVSVVGPGGAAVADGTVITLTNAATGEAVTATVTAGVASFDGLAAGIWTISSTSPGITFVGITVGAAGAGAVGGISAGALTGIVVAGGGATAIALSDDDDDETDPTETPTPISPNS